LPKVRVKRRLIQPFHLSLESRIENHVCHNVLTPFVNPYFTTPQPVRRIQSVMALPYDIIVATVAATMAGNEFAVAAFIHPQLDRLGLETHAKAAASIARILGKIMPIWYALALALILGAVYEHRPLDHGPGLLIALSAALWIATILFTVTMLVPINNRIAGMNPEQPHPTWLQDRSRWDRLHRVRVALLVVAVMLLLTGLLQAASLT
jgi:uncharacterized membrane protein